MKRASRIKPISYLKANAAKVVRGLAEGDEPMIITQNGEATAIIQDIARQTDLPLALAEAAPFVTVSFSEP